MRTIIFTLCLFVFKSISLYSQQGWIIQTASSTLGLNSIQFLNAETGYSVGCDYVYGNFVFLKTTNGGNNWITQYSATNTYKNPMNLFFSDALTGYSVGGDAWLQYPGCFFKTTNGGNNWVSVYLQDTTVFRGIYFQNSVTGYISGSFGYLLKTNNSGNNWIHLNSGTSNALSSIYFIDNNTGFVTGANGTIIKTTDAGNNWFNQVSNTSLSLRSIHFENSNLGFACGSDVYGNNHVILKTTNSGNNWIVLLEEVSNPINHFKSIYFTSINEGYIGSTYKILKTTNSGVNWFYLDLPINNFSESTFGNSVSFINSTTGYICGYNGNSAILKTTNAGISTIPASPSGLSGSYLTNPRRIQLSWTDNSYIENGYKIERKKSTDTLWAIIDSVAQNVTQYNDINIVLGPVVYNYRIFAYNSYGVSGYSNIVSITVTEIKLIENIVSKEFSVSQNYPNPFNPSTKIRFQVPYREGWQRNADGVGFVTLKVFDITGKEVATLVNEQLQPGTYETDWNASAFSSGVYFYKIEAGKYTETKRMLLLK
jgi:photosystem II stability/assembly factor-like uncharacterized protein